MCSRFQVIRNNEHWMQCVPRKNVVCGVAVTVTSVSEIYEAFVFFLCYHSFIHSFIHSFSQSVFILYLMAKSLSRLLVHVFDQIVTERNVSLLFRVVSA